eukprot:TRINITY_DN7147_c0_g1_i1.p1 TRINITY_DN7147_c0_g1~~TRINITY_DN7147_c0_g1_i1.p1  ORF type:complete len:593 (+),score=96.12 TRINITY_DN7147_c0_g1_i1:62-1840(+)
MSGVDDPKIDVQEIHREIGQIPGAYASREEFMRELEEHLSVTGGTARMPVLGGKEVDLFQLYHLVIGAGGSIKVSQAKRWKELCSVFNFPASCTSSSFALKSHYNRILFSFEQRKVYGILNADLSRASNSTPWSPNKDEPLSPRRFTSPIRPSSPPATRASGNLASSRSRTPARTPSQSDAKPSSVFQEKSAMTSDVHMTSPAFTNTRSSSETPIQMHNPSISGSSSKPKNNTTLKQFSNSFRVSYANMAPTKKRRIGAYDGDLTGFRRIICSLDSGIRTEIIWAIGTLSQISADNIRPLNLRRTEGLLDALVRQVSVCLHSIPQENSSQTTNFCAAERVKRSEQVLNLIKQETSDWEEKMERITSIIRNLSFARENEDYMAHNPGLIQCLNDLCGSHEYISTLVVNNVLVTLSNIGGHIHLESAHARSLVTSICFYLDSQEKQQQLLALDMLAKCIVHQHNKATMSAMPDKFFSRLIELVCDSNIEVQRYAIFLLYVMSSFDDTVKVKILEQRNSMRRLLGMLYNVNEEERTALLLRNLSTSAQNRHHFLRHENFFIQVAMSKLGVSDIIGDIVCNIQDHHSRSEPMARLF